MGEQPDLWSDCFTPEHRKLGSPEDFRATFCDKCVNPGCRNSKAAGTKWNRRMASQEENLLTNPRFANPNDPVFQDIRAVDWQNNLREALAIEVNTRKGDWSVPTEQEIGRAAAEMIGIAPPSFSPVPEPELVPEPEPRRLTTKEVILQMRVATTEEELRAAVPEGETRKTVLKVFEAMLPKVAAPPEDEPEVSGHWKVQGDSKTSSGKTAIYGVTLYADGGWACTCASRENPCKHARDISFRLANAPREEPIPEPEQELKRPVTAPQRFRPSRNTATPDGGVMIGGGPPPPTEDPWAPKKVSKDRVIGVGGTIQFGSKKDEVK